MEIQGNAGGLAHDGNIYFCRDVRMGGALTVTGSAFNISQVFGGNTQLNGFSSLFFENISGSSANEKAQIYCGQLAGLNLRTLTAPHHALHIDR